MTEQSDEEHITAENAVTERAVRAVAVMLATKQYTGMAWCDEDVWQEELSDDEREDHEGTARAIVGQVAFELTAYAATERAGLIERLRATEAKRDRETSRAKTEHLAFMRAVDQVVDLRAELDEAHAEVAARDAVISAIRDWRALGGPVAALGPVPEHPDEKDNWLLDSLLSTAPASVLREHDHKLLTEYEEKRNRSRIVINNIDGQAADEWLREHDAEKWDEGYRAAAVFRSDYRAQGYWANDHPRPGMRTWIADEEPTNPYRTGVDHGRERRLTGSPLACEGDSNCDAPIHTHGCYSDFGNCDEPEAHDHE